ncbi:MAG: RNA pseudouridine synthase, partial [Planctomycetales bacterium]|nr:RNA pseudouridine synthase [Planctomycetales bacterium]
MLSPEVPVLLDDGPLVVMSKPGGLLTQAPPDIDSLEARVREWFGEAQGTGGKRPFVGVPHRLDRPASGAIAMTRTPKAARRMADQFELREVDKTYWAIVSGHVEPAVGEWSDFMRKVPQEARSEVVSDEHPDAQYAMLKYRVLASDTEFSWLEIRLETGRTHQIRLQCGSRGFPILGDSQYGSAAEFGPVVTDPR